MPANSVLSVLVVEVVDELSDDAAPAPDGGGGGADAAVSVAEVDDVSVLDVMESRRVARLSSLAEVVLVDEVAVELLSSSWIIVRYCRMSLLTPAVVEPVSVVSELVDVSELADRDRRSEDVLLVSLVLDVESVLLSALNRLVSCALLDDPTPLMDMDLSFVITPPKEPEAGTMPV